MSKLKWETIYKDFRKTHPKMKDSVIWWHPYDLATIVLYLEDGTKKTFDYLSRETKDLEERWK